MHYFTSYEIKIRERNRCARSPQRKEGAGALGSVSVSVCCCLWASLGSSLPSIVLTARTAPERLCVFVLFSPNCQIHIDIPRMSLECLILQPRVTEVRAADLRGALWAPPPAPQRHAFCSPARGPRLSVCPSIRLSVLFCQGPDVELGAGVPFGLSCSNTRLNKHWKPC